MKRFRRIIALFLTMIMVVSCIVPHIGEVYHAAEAITYRNGAQSGPSSSYKNGKYYKHFMQVPITGDNRTDLLAVALSQLGYQEGASNGQFSGTVSGGKNYVEFSYNMGDLGLGYGGSDYPWCAAFVSWCLYQSRCTNQATHRDLGRNHVGDYKYIWKEISCSQWVRQLKGAGYYKYSQAEGGSYVPKSGDLVYFQNSKGVAHIGICLYTANGRIYTVEGNTSDASGLEANGGGVYFKNYALSSSYLNGYGVLPYPSNKSSVAKIDYSGNNPTTGLYVSNSAKNVYGSETDTSKDWSLPRFSMFEVTQVCSNGRLKINYNGSVGYILNNSDRVIQLSSTKGEIVDPTVDERNELKTLMTRVEKARHYDYTEAAIDTLRIAYKDAIDNVNNANATEAKLQAIIKTLGAALNATGSNTIAYNNQGVYISGFNKTVGTGDCIMFSSAYNGDGVVTAANANIRYTVNVVFGWDDDKGVNVVKSVSKGDANTSIKLEGSDFMLAAHDWETGLTASDNPVKYSGTNYQILSSLKPGTEIRLSGARLNKASLVAPIASAGVDPCAYAKFIEEDAVRMTNKDVYVNSGDFILFTTAFDDDKKPLEDVRPSNANVHKALNIICEWNIEKNAWVVVEVKKGSGFEKVHNEGTDNRYVEYDIKDVLDLDVEGKNLIAISALYENENSNDKITKQNYERLAKVEENDILVFSGISPNLGTSISMSANIRFVSDEEAVVLENVALNKEYDATVFHSTANNVKYYANLTDGNAVTDFETGINDKWFGFNSYLMDKNKYPNEHNVDANGTGTVIVDLAQEYDIDTLKMHIYADAKSENKNGYQPGSVKVYVSSDKQMFTPVGELSVVQSATAPYWATLEKLKNVKGRYVKFEVAKQLDGMGWVHINEIEIYAPPVSDSGEGESGSEGVTSGENIASDVKYDVKTVDGFTASLTDGKIVETYDGNNKSSWFAFHNTGDESTGNVRADGKGIITLDLGEKLEILGSSIHMFAGEGVRPPQSVNVYVADTVDGFYDYIGTMNYKNETEAYWSNIAFGDEYAETKKAYGRYVKYAFIMGTDDSKVEWSLFDEIKVYGTPAADKIKLGDITRNGTIDGGICKFDSIGLLENYTLDKFHAVLTATDKSGNPATIENAVLYVSNDGNTYTKAGKVTLTPNGNGIYDLSVEGIESIGKYVKVEVAGSDGTIVTLTDVDVRGTKVKAETNNIALGASYEVEELENANFKTELTDGVTTKVFQNGVNDASWFAFHYTKEEQKEDEKKKHNITVDDKGQIKGIITVDLGAEAEITDTSIHVLAGENELGAKVPSINVYVYVEETDTYVYIGTMNTKSETAPYWTELSLDIEKFPLQDGKIYGRYVKYAFLMGDVNDEASIVDYTLFNEIEVYGTFVDDANQIKLDKTAYTATVDNDGNVSTIIELGERYNLDKFSVILDQSITNPVIYVSEDGITYVPTGDVSLIKNDNTYTLSVENLDITGKYIKFKANGEPNTTLNLTNVEVRGTVVEKTVEEEFNVTLAGSFNKPNNLDDWTSLDMKATKEDGVVSATLTLPAGEYAFKVKRKIENADYWYGNGESIVDRTKGTQLTTSGNNSKLIANGGTYTFTFDINSEELTISSVNVVSLNVTEKELVVGSTLDLKATVNSAPVGATWSSSNEEVATVNRSSGEVTAKDAGVAIITAMTEEGKATCVVTVRREHTYTIYIYTDNADRRTNSELYVWDKEGEEGTGKKFEEYVSFEKETLAGNVWLKATIPAKKTTSDKIGFIFKDATAGSGKWAEGAWKTSDYVFTNEKDIEDAILFIIDGMPQIFTSLPNAVDSPIVSGDTVTFNAYKKGATDVYIWLEDTHRKMTSEGNGFFSYEATLEPGKYQYKFIDKSTENVEDWFLDPFNSSTVVSEGHENNVLIISGLKKLDDELVCEKGRGLTLPANWSYVDAEGNTASVSVDYTVAANSSGNASITNGVLTVKGTYTGTEILLSATYKGSTRTFTVKAKDVLADSITLDKLSANVTVGGTVDLTATVKPDDTTNKTVTWSSDKENVATVVNGVVTANAVGTAVITATTTNGKTVSCTINVKPAVEAVVLDKTNVTLTLGDNNNTFNLSATVTPDDVLNKTVTWSSSDNMVVTVDQNGKVTIKATGTAIITATAGGKSATCTVNVKPVVSGVSLDKTTASLIVEDTLQLTATVTPDDVLNKTVKWSSSDNTVATVDQNGFVTAVGAGTATITATTVNGITANCVVRVSESITINNAITLEIDASSALSTETKPGNTKITWTSGTPSVATVDANGVVTAKAVGTAIITATTQGGATATCTVTVTAKSVVEANSITLNKTTLTMYVGDTDSLIATTDPEGKAVQWSSVDLEGSNVVSVVNGKVTANAAGEAKITAKVDNKTATCIVTVKAAVTNVTLDKQTATIEKDATLKLVATITPDAAKNETVTWSTSNANVATVDQTGKVTAVANGKATITAKAGNKTATCEITVTISVTDVTLSDTAVELKKGTTKTLTATVTPSDAVDKKVTWTSNNNAVVTVNEDGVVTAVGKGTATITAKAGNIEKTCTITVTVPVTDVTLNNTALTLERGQKETLTATVAPADASNTNVTWTSDNESVATVANGVVTAVKAGTATITVTTEDGSKTATCKVTVTVPVEKVTLNKASLTLVKETSETLTATITPSDAENKNVTWTSDKESVATVDENGKVTAVAGGTATITVTTADGRKTASCEVTVTVPVTGVSLDKTTLTLVKGTIQTLTATVAPADASNKDVTWSSSDETVATVANGVVTAVAGGIATITVTTADGSKTASCEVTVTVPVTGVSLDKTTLTLVKESTQTLTATVTPDDATNATVTWTSNNESIATVDETGKVTAVAIGKTMITATVGGYTVSCEVTVTEKEQDVAATGVTLTPSASTLEEGATVQLTATVVPTNATNQNVTWTSDNESVATVDTNGVVTAVKAGTATITVTTADGSKTATCTITVSHKFDKTVATDAYKATDATCKAKATYYYSCECGEKGTETFEYGEVDANAHAWKLATTEAPKTCETCGATEGKPLHSHKYEAVKVKDATCTEAAEYIKKCECGETEGQPYKVGEPAGHTWKPATTEAPKTCETCGATEGEALKPSEPDKPTEPEKPAEPDKPSEPEKPAVVDVASITLDNATVALNKGATVTLVATVGPENATNKTVTWTSSDDKVATVDATGKVTAVANGTATITAKAGDKAATCTVTVTTDVASVKLSKSKANIGVGKTLTLKATITPSDASNQTLKWSTSNKSIATVSSQGVVKGKKAGTVTITVTTANGQTATCTVTVVKATLNAKSFPLELKKSTTALKVTSTLKGDKVKSWKSSDKKIVTVTKSGKITAKKIGKATITVTMKSGATAKVTVNVQKPKVVTKKITFAKKTVTVQKGKTVSLELARNPITGTEKITWTSSNKKVVTVDKNGKVKGLKTGTAIITAKTSNGKKATCKVTVKNPTVKLSKTKATIKVGKTTTIKIKSTFPENDTVKSFKSSNKKVATVDKKGKVKGVKAGTATITVTMKSGAKATFKVTVKK